MRKCWTRCAPWAVHKRGAGVMAGPEVDQDDPKRARQDARPDLAGTDGAGPRTDLPPESKVFLEKRSYRLRRLIDAVRLLPVLGLLLFLSPLLATPDVSVDPTSTANVGIFIFAAWAVMILAAGWLSARIRRGEDMTLEQNATNGDPQ